MSKTVMKGSAGKIVDREQLPEFKVEKPSPSSILINKAQELADAGETIKSIATAIGKDEDWVFNSLLIVKRLPKKVQEAIRDSKFSRTAALQLLLVNPVKLDEVIEGALKIAEVEGKL